VGLLSKRSTALQVLIRTKANVKLVPLVHANSNPLPASLFLSHNESLGPPYRVLVDTNFINFSLQNKVELVQGMMDCLMAKCEFSAPRSPVLLGRLRVECD
jgi:hypothetical protein